MFNADFDIGIDWFDILMNLERQASIFSRKPQYLLQNIFDFKIYKITVL